MALINNTTNEYIKVRDFNLKTGAVQVEIYKDKPTRLATAKYDKVIIETKYIATDLDLSVMCDNTKSIEDSIIIACYAGLRVNTYKVADYSDDI